MVIVHCDKCKCSNPKEKDEVITWKKYAGVVKTTCYVCSKIIRFVSMPHVPYQRREK